MLDENTIAAVIQSREDQGNGVAVLRLVSSDGSGLPGFDAGAHIDAVSYTHLTLPTIYSV